MPKPIHPFTPANADAWIGTSYVLIEQQFGRKPEKDELVTLANASAAGADQDGLRAIMATWPQPERQPSLPLIDPVRDLDANRCVDARGRHVFLRGCTDFSLYWKFLREEDISPVLAERADYGFNLVRVFGMMHYVPQNDFGAPPFKPQDYGERYYTTLAPFVRFLAEHGLYTYFSTFPDVGLIMPNVGEQQRHHDRVWRNLRDGGTALYELTNEIDAHDFNRVDPAQFVRPSGLLACAGSGGEGEHAAFWDFFDFHPRRDYPSHIKDCNLADNPNYLKGRPGLLGEPDRYGSGGNENQMQAFQSAGSAPGTALGIVFHSTKGKKSELFDEPTAACARAFLAGLTTT